MYNENNYITLNKNEAVKFGGNASDVSWINFNISGLVKASGSIQSLVNDQATSLGIDADGNNIWLTDEKGNIIHSNIESSPFSITFTNCSGLLTAPELPAINVNMDNYNNMFEGCTNLNYIKVGFTSWTYGGANGYYNWVKGVSPSGTFVCPVELDITPSGDNYIPSGWTIDTY